MSRVAVLMPAYNEGARLYKTLAALQAATAGKHEVRVFLVDDGGAQRVDRQAIVTAPGFSVTLMRHPVNLGQGAALETARIAALKRDPGFDAYVTMDSDGQHSPDNLDAFVQAIAAGADVAFGNRFAGDSNVPGGRRLVLAGARLFERVITGLALADAHNGYRAFNRAGLAVVKIEQSRMAHATEIKQRVAQHRLKIVEVPVSIRYSGETMQKGQSSLGALQIIVDLLYGYFFRSEKR
jgi:glycosyltransferase involved in cell wall biosynthesis